MNLTELAVRIRSGDKVALRELITTYGGDIYQKAYEKTGDAALAKEVTRRTFAQFVTNLQERSLDDGWALWLDSLAAGNIDAFRRVSSDVEWVGAELERELFGGESRTAAPSAPEAPVLPGNGAHLPARRRHAAPGGGYAQPDRPVSAPVAVERQTRRSRKAREGTKTKKRRTARNLLGCLLLALLCAGLLWVALGVAMSLNWLPKADLGYAWFNSNLFRLF